MIKRLQSAVNELVTLPVPIIAAINGDAYGGGAELATRCDLRVTDPQAVICFSEVRLGLMPDWGGGPSLTRLIGTSRAASSSLLRKANRKVLTSFVSTSVTTLISSTGAGMYHVL